MTMTGGLPQERVTIWILVHGGPDPVERRLSRGISEDAMSTEMS